MSYTALYSGNALYTGPSPAITTLGALTNGGTGSFRFSVSGGTLDQTDQAYFIDTDFFTGTENVSFSSSAPITLGPGTYFVDIRSIVSTSASIGGVVNASFDASASFALNNRQVFSDQASVGQNQYAAANGGAGSDGGVTINFSEVTTAELFRLLPMMH